MFVGSRVGDSGVSVGVALAAGVFVAGKVGKGVAVMIPGGVGVAVGSIPDSAGVYVAKTTNIPKVGVTLGV